MDNNRYYGTQESGTSFCLGHPAHALHPEEMVCRICGTLAAGAQIGVYRVQRLLGTGRGGHAYFALHLRSTQPVVIKLTLPDPVCTDLWDAARREVRVATALRHPGILPVFSSSAWQPTTQSGPLQDAPLASYGRDTYLLTLCQYAPATLPRFIAHYQRRENQQASYEQGGSLLSLLVDLFGQAGAALHAAHTRGMVHGALVPGNILLASTKQLWVADFGLARLHPPAPPYLAPELYAVSNAAMQRGNTSIYWSAVTPQSDQFMFALLCQQAFAQVLQPGEYELMLPVLQRAMHQKPQRRYPSIDLLVRDLVALSTRTIHQPGGGPRNDQPGTRKTDPYITPLPVTPGVPMTPLTPLPAINYNLTGQAQLAATATPVTPDTSIAMEEWEKRGDKLFTMHDYENALKAYHRALETNSNKAALWLALGDTYFALERYKEALMAYEQAMYLDPNDPQAWSNRGTALDALGRRQEALDCYERAEQLQ